VTRIGASCALWAVLLGLSFPPVPVRADADAAEPPGYRRAVDGALAELDAHNFEEARALFLRAHELVPSARTLRGLGAVEFELRNYGRSIAYLERALASTERPLDARLRESTEELLARARGFVATVHLDLQPRSPRAEVLVDGVPVPLEAGAALTLEVGDHVVEVRDASYLPERRKLSLHGGEHQRLQIALRKPLEPASATADTRSRRAWLWTGVGVVVAGAAAATAVALTRSPSASSSLDGGNTNVSLQGPGASP
jgi:tetratricopeptide (TPR) repeat protein